MFVAAGVFCALAGCDDTTLRIADFDSSDDTDLVGRSPNEPPVIKSLRADPDSVDILGTTSLICVAVDPNGEDLSYSWSCGAGSLQPSPHTSRKW